MNRLVGSSVLRRPGALFFALPFLTLFILFWLAPMAIGLRLSLSSDSMWGYGAYTGLDNYRSILRDALFWLSLKHTLIYAVTLLIITLPLATALACLLRGAGPGVRRFSTFCLVLPALTPPTVLAILFLLVFHGKQGLLNGLLLEPLGLEPVNWLKDPDFIMPALVLQAAWRWTGFTAFFLLTAMDAIPRIYHEAALIEGPPSWKTFRWITLPQIRRVLFFCAVYLFIDAAVAFSGAYILLGASGGTDNAGLLLVNYIYQKFHFGQSSSAAAAALIVAPSLLAMGGILLALRPRSPR